MGECWTIEVLPAEGADDPRGRAAGGTISTLGLRSGDIRVADVYFIALAASGNGEHEAMQRAAESIFCDPVTQVWRIEGSSRKARSPLSSMKSSMMWWT